MVRALDRRQFLQRTVALSLTSLGAGRPQAQRPADEPVVVIGAGLAGLHLAGLLRRAGRAVVVLEARAIPGGRVRTLRGTFKGALFGEAGPVRVAGVHRRVLQLAGAHGLTFVPFALTDRPSLVRVRGVTARVPDDLGSLTAKLELRPDEAGLGGGALVQRYLRDVPAELGDPLAPVESFGRWAMYDSRTWPQWLMERGASSGAIGLMTAGGDSRDLSALYVIRQVALIQNAQQFYKIRGGMDGLPRAMARALGNTVRYQAAAVRVDHGSTPARVDYVEQGRTKRSIRASRVVLAVPFSVLRPIEIQPGLSPPKRQVIDDLAYFSAARFLLQTRTRFWDGSGLSGAARTDAPVEIWDAAYDLPGERGLLGATVGGEIAEKLRTMDRAQAIRLGIDLVSAGFPEVRASVESGTVYRWALDPWARGAFAVFHPGQMTSMMPEIARPEGRVHFAGEHTSAWMGWMEGALESAERVANEILT